MPLLLAFAAGLVAGPLARAAADRVRAEEDARRSAAHTAAIRAAVLDTLRHRAGLPNRN